MSDALTPERLDEIERHASHTSSKLPDMRRSIESDATILALVAAYRERDAAFDSGRNAGRAEVAKYSRALGEIEAVVGIAGAVPMRETVAAVRSLAQRAEAAEKERDELRAMAKRHLSAADERDELRRAVGGLSARWRMLGGVAESHCADELDAAIERGEHVK